jgi:hypothetical protein
MLTVLTMNLTYSDSGNAPTNAGSYIVIAAVADKNYQSGTNSKLAITRATGILFRLCRSCAY